MDEPMTNPNYEFQDSRPWATHILRLSVENGKPWKGWTSSKMCARATPAGYQRKRAARVFPKAENPLR